MKKEIEIFPKPVVSNWFFQLSLLHLVPITLIGCVSLKRSLGRWKKTKQKHDSKPCNSRESNICSPFTFSCLFNNWCLCMKYWSFSCCFSSWCFSCRWRSSNSHMAASLAAKHECTQKHITYVYETDACYSLWRVFKGKTQKTQAGQAVNTAPQTILNTW